MIAFHADRRALDPELGDGDPFNATGVTNVAGVAALIARYRARANEARSEACG